MDVFEANHGNGVCNGVGVSTGHDVPHAMEPFKALDKIAPVNLFCVTSEVINDPEENMRISVLSTSISSCTNTSSTADIVICTTAKVLQCACYNTQECTFKETKASSCS